MRDHHSFMRERAYDLVGARLEAQETPALNNREEHLTLEENTRFYEGSALPGFAPGFAGYVISILAGNGGFV